MTLRRRLGAYLIVLHLAFLAATVMLFRQSTALFLGLEALLLCSLALGFVLLRQALAPLAYTRHIHDLLQDQHYAARLQQSGDAELNQLVTLFNTMLGRLYQERLQLGEQQGFLDKLLEATPSAVVVFDFDGGVSLLNASAQTLLDLAPDAARGRTLADCAPRSSAADLLQQLDALPSGDSQLLTDADGRRFRGQRGQFFDRGFPRHFLLVEELTAELERSEQAAYDKLIRVLAHEVNNTVAATGSVLDSLLYYRDQLSARDSEDFSTAIVAVQRRNASLGEFIERFTRVVKMPAPELRPVPVKELMDDILYLYREPCRSRAIRIEWLRCDAAAPIAMDRQLMEQALLNIVKNAMEAVEAAGADGGQIGLTLMQEAEGLRLSVTDSGRQLGALSPRQLFTPFFTTKKGGQGIGLLFVREVLNRHGFGYRLAPDAAGLTSFDIWLRPAVV